MKRIEYGYGLIGQLKKSYGHKPNLFDEFVFDVEGKTYRILFDYGCPMNYLLHVFQGKEQKVLVCSIHTKSETYWYAELIKTALMQNVSFNDYMGASADRFISFLESTEEGQKVFDSIPVSEQYSYASVMY